MAGAAFTIAGRSLLGSAGAGAGAGGSMVEMFAISGAMNQLAGKARDATQPVKILGAMFGAVNLPVIGLTATLRAFELGVTGMGRALSHFVEKANPAHVKLFEFAADDLTASIGQALIPALQFATKFTRTFADVAFAMAPSVNRLLKTFFEPFAAMLPGLVNSLEPLIVLFDVFTRVLADVFKAMMSGFAALERMAGFRPFSERGGGGISGGSVGAAFRGAQIGSVESFQNKALTAAFGLGTASATPESRTAEAAENIYNWLKIGGETVVQAILKLPADMAQAVVKLIGVMNPLAGGAAAVGVAGAGDAMRRVEDRAAMVSPAVALLRAARREIFE